MNPNITRTMQIIQSTSDVLKHKFSPDEAQEVVSYTIRKCEVCGKDEEYFYILLENELKDFLMRAYINHLGVENFKRRTA